jgi:hypothetical protein
MELTLTLLEAGVLLVDHVQLAPPFNKLAVFAAFFDRRPDFHARNVYLYL